MLIFIGRTKNILHMSRALVKSYLDSCFFYFGLLGGVLITEVEEGVDVSFDSLLLVLTSSTSSIVNLFTEGFWGAFFAGCSIQNSLLRETLFPS